MCAFRSTVRPPVEISYRTQVDDVADDASDRLQPQYHPAPFYLPPRDIVINSRPDDATSHNIRDPPGAGGGAPAAGAFPSLLTNYQFYVGTPDLKPATQRASHDPHHPQDS